MSKYNVNHKTFIKALETFSVNLPKFKRFFTDRRLTHAEKNILKAKVSIRNSNFTEALEYLKFTSSNPFIKAHQLFLQGTAYNNAAMSHEAIPLLKASYIAFIKIDHKQLAFNPLYALVITLMNQKNPTQMEFYLNEMRKMSHTAPFRQACLYRCEALYYSLINQDNKALEKINLALSLKSKKLETRKAFFLVGKFVILFKLKRCHECEEVLNEYKNTKGFVHSANYNFMKILLAHFLHDSPIYAYKKHFKDSHELEYQVNTIKELSIGEIELAKIWWSKLKEINPVLYKEDFQYSGDYGLFSACLAKHLSHNTEKTLSFNIQKFMGTNQERLLHILQTATKTHTKEELIRMIWDEEYTEESSSRFNKLLSRTKKKYGLDVRVRKGSYRLFKDIKVS